MYKSWYNILNTNLCLETPFKKINDFCDYMWQEFPCDNTSSSEMVIKVVPCVNKKDHFSVFKGSNIAIDWGKELTEVSYSILSKALENIVSGYALNQIDKKNLITLHSGAVCRNNNGILILGESGNGKSTLTLELVANHNWDYLTDEVGLLDPDHVIHPFLKTISYKRECIVNIHKTWETQKFGIDHQMAVPKKKHGKSTPLKAIFFVKYNPDKKPAIIPVKKSEALVRLMNSQIGRAKYVATLEQMAEVVKKVNAFQLFHNNARNAAGLITNLIDSIK